MGNFANAVLVVLEHEGGFSNNPADPGGATNWGISLRYLRSELSGDSDRDGRLDWDLDGDGDIDEQDVRLMSQEQAVEIYRTKWWARLGYERLADDLVATKMFDTAVNVGARRAHLFAQRTARLLGHHLEEDGVLGPLSVEAVNQCPSRYFVWQYGRYQAQFYRDLVASKPSLAQFLTGWLRRAAWPCSRRVME